MAKDKLVDYDSTASGNLDVGGISVAEGMLPSNVNNAIREQMSHLKDFADGTEAINALAVDNLKMDGNTISSTDTNGNINLSPNGTGVVALSSTDLTFGDNDKAIFGAGSDLQIYHNGSASDIKETGTGNLRIWGDDIQFFNSAGSKYHAQMITDGAITLYYNGAEKLSTTATGVDVTGGLNTTGNVGIGVTPATTQTLTTQITNGLSLFGNNTTPYGFISSNHVWATGTGDMYLVSGYGASYYKQYSGVHSWATAPAGTANNPITFSEAMRIDSSGNLRIGTTTAQVTAEKVSIAGGLGIQKTDDYPLGLVRGNTYGQIAAFFNYSGTLVGSINVAASSTSYVTSSDYRLKENVTADWDATTRLKQLNPVRFNFISDADTTVDGFLAHEVEDIVPESITGTKDAMRDEEYEVSAATGDIYTPAIEAVLDEDGNEVTPAVAEVIHSTDVERPEELAEGQQWRETTAAVMGTRSVPDYQGIDQSKLVPLLVKTIQELEARITALEAN